MGAMRLEPPYPVDTARLALSPLTPEDLPALLAYRGREDVCRYLPFPPMTAEVLRARLGSDLGRVSIDEEGQGLTLGARRRDTGELIGDLVLFFRSREHRGGELGYVFHPGVVGQGYAAEACRAMLALGFGQLGLHRVVARMDARNVRSARLAARLGMRQEAFFQRDEWFKGEWSDTLIFALLAEEWAAGRATNDSR